MSARFLRKGFAGVVKIGPFLDSNGAPVTTLDIDRADVRLSKNGGAFAQKNDTTDNAAHTENGIYNITINATDTDTVGELMMVINETGALPVRTTFAVLDELAYDIRFGSLAQRLQGVFWYGTLGSVANTSVTFSADPGFSKQAQILITLTGGTNAIGKSRFATYSGSGEVWTVDKAWNADGETTPSGTVTAIVTSVPAHAQTNVPNVGQVASLGTQAKADVNAEATAALTTYGALKPTVAGRTLGVSTTGGASVNWGAVENPGTTVNLSNTTVKDVSALGAQAKTDVRIEVENTLDDCGVTTAGVTRIAGVNLAEGGTGGNQIGEAP